MIPDACLALKHAHDSSSSPSRRRLAPWCAVVMLLVGGCASHVERMRDVRNFYYAGELETAGRLLDEEVGKRPGEDEAFLLEKAMIDLSAGRPRESERVLRYVRDRFDHFEQKSAAEDTLALWTDDNVRSYAGEDYEKVLIRTFLALSDLMDDGGDANAYAIQVTQKQDAIVHAARDAEGNNPKLAYKRVAIGPYLAGVLQEETHLNYDDAQRNYAKVVSWEPAFEPGPHDLQRARSGHHSRPGYGVVYVFTLVGVGPRKEEVVELPSTVALLVADRILSATNKYSLPPNIAPVKVPKVVRGINRIDAVGVTVNGTYSGATRTIADIGTMAVEQYEAVYPQVLARAVVRRVVKKGTVYALKTVGDVNPTVSTLMDVAGVAWEATETADTRCWSLLPDKIQVLRLELPEGTHQLELQSHDDRGPWGPRFGQDVQVRNGRNTYVLACFPADQLVGRILTNEPVEHERGKVRFATSVEEPAVAR